MPSPTEASRVTTAAAAAVAGEEADDGVEHGHDAVDNGHDDAADAVDDGHDGAADSADHGLDARYDCAHFECVFLLCSGFLSLCVVLFGSWF